ncbi:MAG: hypothetical protein DRH97_04415 [Chloroflexi bacterium]|nr:MAG: hypothetical protein DRH97_04415 [Chloroflexota bacterium]
MTKDPYSNPPLANDEAEWAVLGSLLIDPSCVWDIKGVLRPGDFALLKHQHIYTGVLSLADRGEPVDIITLMAELRSMGVGENVEPSYISELISGVPSAINALSYADEVVNCSRRRELLRMSGELAKRGFDAAQNVDQTVTWLAMATSGQARGGDIQHAKDVVEQVYMELETHLNVPLSPGEVRGLDTGWADLNKMLGGWKPGLYFALGEPHVGKSWLGLHAAANVAKAGGRSLVFSLEMTARQLIRRLCLAHARITQDEYDSGKVDADRLARFYERMADIADWDLDVVDNLEAASAIFATIHRECRTRKKPDFVVVDYMGLVLTDYRTKNRNEELSALAREMKRVTTSNQIAMFTPHQISDKDVARRKDKRPRKSDGYGSGGISQHGDVLLGLYDESMHSEEPKHINVLEVSKLKDRLSGGANAFKCVLLRFEPTGALSNFTDQQDPNRPPPEIEPGWEDKYD